MTPFAVVLLVLATIAALSLIGIGLALERQSSDSVNSAAELSPSREVHAAIISPLEQGSRALSASGVPLTRVGRVRQILAQHPAPALGVIENVFWIGIVITLVLHLLDPADGAVAYIIWALTIGPHEIGHVICMPFGWFLHIAGGSIWQVLVFVLPALYAFYVRRLIAGSLIFWALTGHSLINLARYIDDARARDLPLIMGLSKDHHDWWNLLRDVDMLTYDHLLATLTTITGAIIILLAASVGILSAWGLPRTGIGPTVRYTGGYWSAIRARLWARN